MPALTIKKANDKNHLIVLPLEEIQSSVGFIPGGLSQEEAEIRLGKYGFNEVAKEKPLSPWRRLFINLKNPLVILLAILGIVSFLTGDVRATIGIFIMVLLGAVLRLSLIHISEPTRRTPIS